MLNQISIKSSQSQRISQLYIFQTLMWNLLFISSVKQAGKHIYILFIY